jgi:hypothetical protein
MFADDTSLYCVVEDQTSAVESLNEDLECNSSTSFSIDFINMIPSFTI